MLSFISFLLVCIGCINWFCIGILQFDFVAGIFGSQSNIFSRLVYTLVGIAAIIVIVNFITNKGRFIVSFKKANEDFEEIREEKKTENKREAFASIESADEFSLAKKLKNESNKNNYHTESGKDYGSIHNKSNNCSCGKDCDCDHKHDE